jgi:hypothetical protein
LSRNIVLVVIAALAVTALGAAKASETHQD